MMFWILAAVLTAGLVAPLVAVLARGRPVEGEATDEALAVYRDQLAELERDQARGTLSPDDAEAARTEVARRMLAADRARGGRSASGRPARWLALALAALLPIATLSAYLAAGRPDLPSQPLASRDPGAMEAHRQMLAETAELARRLEADGGSAADWTDLGQRYRAVGRFEDAVAALARAVGVSEGDPDIVATYAEALVEVASGIVSEQAREAFEQVQAARPSDPRPHYYLALARAQAGDDEGALADWQALLGASPADAPWRPLVIQRVMEAAERLGLDPEEAVPAAAGGPGADAVTAAAELSPDERADMIRGMVDGLAARLEQEPEDLAGWMRLAQAYRVMGRVDDAATALSRAADLAPDDPAILSAQAETLMMTSTDGVPPVEAVVVLQRLLQADPENAMALWLLGVAAHADGREEDAAGLWNRLLPQLPPDSDERRLLQERLDAIAGAS